MKNKQKDLIKNLLTPLLSISQLFHKKTSFNNLLTSNLPYEKWPTSWKTIHYKEYPRFEATKINDKKIVISKSFSSILQKRRSQRNFGGSVGFKKLQNLIKLSAGINSHKNNNFQLRHWPSAGARYPLEIYILNSKINGLKKCFSFHYNVKRNTLERLFPIKNPGKFFFDITGQDWSKEASCIIAISSVFDRNKIKYGDRGYRYSLIDCGHLSQNILLTATALNLKACSIGGFSDTKINKHLDLNEVQEAIIYMIAIGK